MRGVRSSLKQTLGDAVRMSHLATFPRSLGAPDLGYGTRCWGVISSAHFGGPKPVFAIRIAAGGHGGDPKTRGDPSGRRGRVQQARRCRGGSHTSASPRAAERSCRPSHCRPSRARREAAERALALDRNLANAHAFIGAGKTFAGRAEESEAHVQEALRLSPRDSFAYQWMASVAATKLNLGADAEAAQWARRSIEANRNYPLAHFWLAAALAQLGRIDEARQAVQPGLALAPGFTLARYRAGVQSDNPTYHAQRERIIEGMRKAGVPEGVVGAPRALSADSPVRVKTRLRLKAARLLLYLQHPTLTAKPLWRGSR